MLQQCDFCGGLTARDTRGNCAACGAPRHRRNNPFASTRIVLSQEMWEDMNIDRGYLSKKIADEIARRYSL